MINITFHYRIYKTIKHVIAPQIEIIKILKAYTISMELLTAFMLK